MHLGVLTTMASDLYRQAPAHASWHANYVCRHRRMHPCTWISACYLSRRADCRLASHIYYAGDVHLFRCHCHVYSRVTSNVCRHRRMHLGMLTTMASDLYRHRRMHLGMLTTMASDLYRQAPAVSACVLSRRAGC